MTRYVLVASLSDVFSFLTLMAEVYFLVSAFREVFDLFDSNGGGTIDAEELDSTLQSVDIHLTQEEIREVLANIDVDGKSATWWLPNNLYFYCTCKVRWPCV